ncbi:diphosphomevalonate decarboxylase [Gorgonomyces haynaldii]|nr:diphosphomevalonate decarboxylase [Gorgonomyces haynaldii]
MLSGGEMEVTCSAPVNIAVIKYWGKRDSNLILPTNSSLSVTLNQDDLRSTTSIRCSKELEKDRLWLNGKEEDIQKNKRLVNVISTARALRLKMEQTGDLEPMADLKVWINSVNNFPTAAGLASSASGFACLTFALKELYQLNISIEELSRLARLGSGSACRSVFGGFVAWEMGQQADGSDSFAIQVQPAEHWPDMEALILVVSDDKKDVGSTVGMQQTVETSSLFQQRLQVVPERMEQMKQAITQKNFDRFAELTMMDSNQFHSVCLDTFPPVFYMNDVSRYIVRLITEYNHLFTSEGKGYQAAYTYDAGPNCVLYLPRKNVQQVLQLIDHYLPRQADQDPQEYYGRALDFKAETEIPSLRLQPLEQGKLKRIISTSIGDGPRVLSRGFGPASLFDQHGNPK